MDEFQRKRVTKQLTAALKELGFKPSKVSKLINAGRFIQTCDYIDEGWCYFGRSAWMTGPEIVEKMVEGRIKKFLSEISLTEQGFVKDPDTTVAKLLKQEGAVIHGFSRFEVGEGIEKEEVDFAAEVQQQLS